MGFVALKRLRWGEETIMPGEPVPEGEEGRSYGSLLAHGLIAETSDLEGLSDAELAKHAKELKEKLDAAHERIGELEGHGGDPPVSVEVPDEVTPGVTAGWPLDATTGEPLALSDEQRAELVEEILPEGTEAEPVSAIVTHQGELVVVNAPDGPEKPETAQSSGADQKEKEGAPKAKASGKGK
jgi:hypothetical protein